MSRHLVSTSCFILGLLLLGTGLLFPVYFKVIDSDRIILHGQSSASLVSTAAATLDAGQSGAARKLAQAAQLLELPDAGRLAAHVQARSKIVSDSSVFQGDEKTTVQLFENSPGLSVIEHLLGQRTRDKATLWLEKSGRSLVQRILSSRDAATFQEFLPARFPGGQPLEAVVILTALLAQTDHFSPGLQEELETALDQSSTNVFKLETFYLDLLTLGGRMSWSEFSSLGRKLDSMKGLHSLAEAAEAYEEEFPVVYAAVFISKDSRGVSDYIQKYPTNTMHSFGFAFRHKTGAVQELLRENKPIHFAAWRAKLAEYNPFGAVYDQALKLSARSPSKALFLKWLLLFSGSSLVAWGIVRWFLVSDREIVSNGSGMFYGQTAALSVSLLVVTLVLSEPMPAAGSPQPQVSFQMRIPGSIPTLLNSVKKSTQITMNTSTLIPLVIFFVLQATIYIWCLSKLAEIKREAVEPRIKLKLLDNEEHLFDAGLYLGFGGTVVSLILVSMGIITQGIMSAYGSTSFGILFVTILKIFHIRPYRRQLIYQTEELQQIT